MEFSEDASYELDGELPTIFCLPKNGERATYSFLGDDSIIVKYKKFIDPRRDNFRPNMGMKNILKLLHKQIKEETGKILNLTRCWWIQVSRVSQNTRLRKQKIQEKISKYELFEFRTISQKSPIISLYNF